MVVCCMDVLQPKGYKKILPAGLEGSLVAESVLALHALYEEITRAQETWKEKSPFRCPPGCGRCCETFEPDVLEVEALYLAVWMFKNQRERLGTLSFETPSSGCFLADSANPYHCTVYEGRPLICRLFAYAGDRDKKGRVRFRPCKYQEGYEGVTYGEETLLSLFRGVPPVMADYTALALGIMPAETGHRLPLRQALPSALNKVRYLLDLAAFSASSESPFRDDDTDNDGPPLDKAS
ncbi:YkgJ family cysteine cluster protein [Treponema sp. J25]|uniref:YkgJ family cysteine cluster protein n=1 Tax=Treponema sp. J25 TaxID=2094121 RepID=UPI0010458771|nr:YkgJ family cysteine cluster protein [Treponema sp. J25]TCW60997.1 YkgJ family cysteine cluster protein [Treponema sp. J25]